MKICRDDCHICETEAWALNAQLDCPHDSVTLVYAWGIVWPPDSAWCNDCGKAVQP